MLEEPIRILSEPPIVGATGRLDVRHVPRRRPGHAQQRFGMRRAGADFEIKRLLNQAALLRPVVLELEDQVLECHVTNAAVRSIPERTVAPSRGASLSVSDESV